MTDQHKKSEMERHWNYRPNVPIQPSPFMQWPPDFRRMGPWLRVRWFNLAENAILVVLATLTWLYLTPELETMKVLEAGWVFTIWARNIVMIGVLAGALHWYFHSAKKQSRRLKFDPRDLMMKARSYTFNHQLLDNMFWTLVSGVAFWTAFEVLMLWALANGYVVFLSPLEHPFWFALILFLQPVWISFHFYWIHRALHWPPLYKLAHALHHRNINVGPWSGISMHPVEHVMFFSSALIHFVVPMHPIHLIFQLQHQALTGVTSHTGFEGLVVRDKNWLALGTFHHQLHHRYFECNYGNLEVPWDKYFGSFHDGTDESHREMMARRRAAE